MVGGQVAVGKVSASSNNVHTNLLPKFSEINLNQGMQKYESRNEEVQDFGEKVLNASAKDLLTVNGARFLR